MLEGLLKINFSSQLDSKWFQYLILNSFRVLLNLTEWIGLKSFHNLFIQCRIESFIEPFIGISSRVPTLNLILSELKQSLAAQSDENFIHHHKRCSIGNWIEKSLGTITNNIYEVDKYSAGLSTLYNLNCCAYCHKGNITNLKLCSKCKKILYCGKECQKSHYSVHKSECKSSS